MATTSDEARGEARSRGGGRVTIDRPTYDELQFEENFQPLGYNRLKVFNSAHACMTFPIAVKYTNLIYRLVYQSQFAVTLSHLKVSMNGKCYCLVVCLF